MGAAGAFAAGARTARPAASLGPAAVGQRHLLRPAHRLCLALFAARVSALANGVYDIPPVAFARGLAADPRGLATERPPAGWARSRTLGGDHGQSECENHRRIWPHQGGRRGPKAQGTAAAMRVG